MEQLNDFLIDTDEFDNKQKSLIGSALGVNIIYHRFVFDLFNI